LQHNFMYFVCNTVGSQQSPLSPNTIHYVAHPSPKLFTVGNVDSDFRSVSISKSATPPDPWRYE